MNPRSNSLRPAGIEQLQFQQIGNGYVEIQFGFMHPGETGSFGGNPRGIHPRVIRKGQRMVGAGGLVVSIIVFAVGAILDWAVTVSSYQHGFNVNKVGQILMIVGVVGAVLSIIVMVLGNTRRRQTVVDDGHGNVVRRVDSTY